MCTIKTEENFFTYLSCVQSKQVKVSKLLLLYLSCVNFVKYLQSKQMKVSKLLYILIMCTIKTEESK